MKKPSGVTGRLFHCLYISFSARDVAFMQLYSYLCIIKGYFSFHAVKLMVSMLETDCFIIGNRKFPYRETIVSP